MPLLSHFLSFCVFIQKNGRFRRRWLFVEKINVLDYNNIKIKHSNYALKEDKRKIKKGVKEMSREKVFKTMDGNEAAAHIAYAFTEVAPIFPITPSSPMAEHV